MTNSFFTIIHRESVVNAFSCSTAPPIHSAGKAKLVLSWRDNVETATQYSCRDCLENSSIVMP